MLNEETLRELSANPNTLYIGADVGQSEWKLAGAGRGTRRVQEKTVGAGDDAELMKTIRVWRANQGLGEGPTVLVHEAGRDGFSIARRMEMLGVTCLVVDPASIETDRRKRSAKTDRLDALRMLKKLRSFVAGDSGVFSVVRVPEEVQEDQRRAAREREHLTREISKHKTRINGLLALQGVKLELNQGFVAELGRVTTSWGTPLAPQLKSEVLRELERMELAQHQLEQLLAAQVRAMKQCDSAPAVQGAKLAQLVGVGVATAMTLPLELFWRDFKNPKEVGAAAGLTGTPRVTGTSTDIEQGISKAGNSRVRTLMIEIAWMWVRLQPDSPITRWFRDRQDGSARAKRKAIVAVARKLLIALWRYATRDIVPEGALLKTAST